MKNCFLPRADHHGTCRSVKDQSSIFERWRITNGSTLWHTELARRGVRVTVVAASDDLRDELACYGLNVNALSIKAAVDALSTGNL